MADAFLILVMILVIVGVCAFMVWDLSVSLTREVRRGRLAESRALRAVEDRAWQEWLVRDKAAA